ncbi:sugar dehydrogenase complex small subunit [Vibrio sp. ABG19]|uniref:sugar dehydrogenase complex small subunit n=1 Tax=Vibrio sp. ABG19 TaxID=2817385 RepID=UPI00249E4168|nr:sugar dehydrogenase complex small subunit [Vibrio sp. ABG19]WGY45697.1 sorbitol dehydrogenase family protein [Vibrio sp. ABG19]
MTNYSRRRVLKMVGVVTIAGAAGQLLPLSSLHAAQPPAKLPQLDGFLQVSRLLTGIDTLNETVAHALVIALDKTQKDFAASLIQLKTLFQSQPELLEQEQLAFGDIHANSEQLAKEILSGWYNGVVGTGFDALYVTYINNLANQLVSDKVVPPSFSYGPIGSWAQQP